MIGAREWVDGGVDELGEEERLGRGGVAGELGEAAGVLPAGVLEGAGAVAVPLGVPTGGAAPLWFTTMPGPRFRAGGVARTRVSPAMASPRTINTTRVPVIRRVLVLPMTPLWALQMRRR